MSSCQSTVPSFHFPLPTLNMSSTLCKAGDGSIDWRVHPSPFPAGFAPALLTPCLPFKHRIPVIFIFALYFNIFKKIPYFENSFKKFLFNKLQLTCTGPRRVLAPKSIWAALGWAQFSIPRRRSGPRKTPGFTSNQQSKAITWFQKNTNGQSELKNKKKKLYNASRQILNVPRNKLPQDKVKEELKEDAPEL
jgi:hypothetical protein